MNIIQIAEMAGVSPATVSRVINGTARVSDKTKAKVLNCIEKNKYHPNIIGQNMRNQRSNLLLVLVSDMGNAYFSDVLRGMDDTARQFGYNIFVASTYYDPEREKKQMQLLQNKTVDGAILLSPVMSKQELEKYAASYPVLQCCEYITDCAVPHISIDNYSASFQAVQYLVKCGRKRIGYIGHEDNDRSVAQRFAAYKQALQDSGQPIIAKNICHGKHSFEFGVQAMQEILKNAERPDAIFTTSDRIAAGCLKALMNAGIKVPDEIAVLGFDNIDISKIVTPALSTVAQPMRKLGNIAVDSMVKMINGETISEETFLSHEIIIRETT